MVVSNEVCSGVEGEVAAAVGVRALVLVDLDVALVELAVQRFRLERVELVRLDQLRQLRATDDAGLRCTLQQDPYVLVLENALDVDRHLAPVLFPLTRPGQTYASRIRAAEEPLRRSVWEQLHSGCCGQVPRRVAEVAVGALLARS